MKPPKFQFSKLVGIFAAILLVWQLIVVNIVAAKGGDTSFAWYTVPIPGTIFATWYVAYSNKEKPINVLKAIIAFRKELQSELGADNPAVKEETDRVCNMYSDVLSDKLNEAMSEDNQIENLN